MGPNHHTDSLWMWGRLATVWGDERPSHLKRLRSELKTVRDKNTQPLSWVYKKFLSLLFSMTGLFWHHYLHKNAAIDFRDRPGTVSVCLHFIKHKNLTVSNYIPLCKTRRFCSPRSMSFLAVPPETYTYMNLFRPSATQKMHIFGIPRNYISLIFYTYYFSAWRHTNDSVRRRLLFSG